MAFDATIIHWPTLSAFIAYLQGVPRPAWVRGITNHNTFVPNESQWRGLASMQSMQAVYIKKGWSAGPHLYLVAEAPNAPTATGIWQMTPLSHVGVHAGECNKDHLGIENVGDFDKAPPSAAQMTLLLAVNRAILQAWGLPPESVNVHNECMSGRTCPGKYLTGAQIRSALYTSWPRPDPIDPFARWGSIGKPEGAAQGFAIPKAWLMNQTLGACVVPEQTSASKRYAVAEFERGIIIWYAAKNMTDVRLF
jgi:hypothetical protein